jgi:hypothetical protein
MVPILEPPSGSPVFGSMKNLQFSMLPMNTNFPTTMAANTGFFVLRPAS